MATANSTAASGANGTNGTNSVLDEISSKAPPGTVLPPRQIREIIEKSAVFIARNGMPFEERIRRSQSHNPSMSFLIPEDEYAPYYRWRVAEIKAGRGATPGAGRKGTEVTFQGREARTGPEKPQEYGFSARMPNISAQDLEVVKLTALFVAKNGRGWMTRLSQREAGNFQFDFLRPKHSLYQLFSRLLEQYTAVLDGTSVFGEEAQKKRVEELEANIENPFRIVDRARARREWAAYQKAQVVVKEELEIKEKIAYAQIDWHDFVVVAKVIFSEEDGQRDLPPPPSLNDLQSASLEQKAAMSIDPNRRIEEALPTFDDYEQFYGQPAQMPPAQVTPAVQPPQYSSSPAQGPPTQPPMQQAHPLPPPPSQDYEADRVAALQADRERARVAREAATANRPMKIRTDYVPAALAWKEAQAQARNSSICPNCKQAIPNDEMAQHLRIEMLDPQWREQARIAQQRSAMTNLSTQDMASNLKRLASQRSDLFDPVTGEGISPEEQERRKRAELQAYDGVSIMPNPHALAGMTAPPTAGGPPSSFDSGATPTDVQEQIRQLHQKYKT